MHAHGVLAEMLRDLEHQAVAVVRGLERVQDLPAASPSNCTSTTAPMTWRDATRGLVVRDAMVRPRWVLLGQSASAPEMISMSSLVIMRLARAVVGDRQLA